MGRKIASLFDVVLGTHNPFTGLDFFHQPLPIHSNPFTMSDLWGFGSHSWLPPSSPTLDLGFHPILPSTLIAPSLPILQSFDSHSLFSGLFSGWFNPHPDPTPLHFGGFGGLFGGSLPFGGFFVNLFGYGFPIDDGPNIIDLSKYSAAQLIANLPISSVDGGYHFLGGNDVVTIQKVLGFDTSLPFFGDNGNDRMLILEQDPTKPALEHITLQGGMGNDELDVMSIAYGARTHILYGDGGDDTLTIRADHGFLSRGGGQGIDLLYGGPGADTFVMAPIGIPGVLPRTINVTIEDFSPLQGDKIDLKAYDFKDATQSLASAVHQQGADTVIPLTSSTLIIANFDHTIIQNDLLSNHPQLFII